MRAALQLFVVVILSWCSSSVVASEDGGILQRKKLLGVLDYKGGFVSIAVKMDPPQLIKNFELDVPTFCKDLDILSAGTVSEGVHDDAEAINGSKFTFAVNKGAGFRISTLDATLNGPDGLSCHIPVYELETVVPVLVAGRYYADRVHCFGKLLRPLDQTISFVSQGLTIATNGNGVVCPPSSDGASFVCNFSDASGKLVIESNSSYIMYITNPASQCEHHFVRYP